MLRVCVEEENLWGINVSTANDINLIKGLFTPQLSKLYINFVDGDALYAAYGAEEEEETERHVRLQEELLLVYPAMEGLIKLIPERSPKLRSLGLQTELESPKLLSSIKAVLSLATTKLHYLEHFTLNAELSMDGSLLAALGTVPNLRALSSCSMSSLENPKRGMDYGSFAKLERVQLFSWERKSCLINTIRPTLAALQSISIWLNKL